MLWPPLRVADAHTFQDTKTVKPNTLRGDRIVFDVVK